jgi:hypothetical protein
MNYYDSLMRRRNIKGKILKRVIRTIECLTYSIHKPIFQKDRYLVRINNNPIRNFSIKQLKMMKNNNLLTKW